jgi:hypothetical protein
MVQGVVMIANLKPYPEYKTTGLSWLGQVPSGWRIVRNGSLFAQRNQTDVFDDNELDDEDTAA